MAITTTGLTRRYGETTVLDGSTSRRGRHGARAARPERRRQDHRRADPVHAAAPRRGAARRSPASTWSARPRRCARRIGLVGQHAAVDEVLSGRQNLVMFGRLHHLGARRARGGGPTSCWSGSGWPTPADRPVEHVLRRHAPPARPRREPDRSTRRCSSSTSRPPAWTRAAAAEVWQAVRALVAGGTTVLLTTQYLEEADQLADRVTRASTAGGSSPTGTPDELKSAIGGDRLDVVVADAGGPAAAATALRPGSPADAPTSVDEPAASASPVTDRVAALTAVVRALDDAGDRGRGRRPAPAHPRRGLPAPDRRRPGAGDRVGRLRGPRRTVTLRDLGHWAPPTGALVVIGLLFPVLMLLMFGYLLGGGMTCPAAATTEFLSRACSR